MGEHSSVGLVFDSPRGERSAGGPYDSRVLTALKANYAPKATELRLKWDDGAYVRVDEGGGVVADIERRQLHKLMTDMVSDGEARGSLYSASPRAETRYIVKMLAHRTSRPLQKSRHGRH